MGGLEGGTWVSPKEWCLSCPNHIMLIFPTSTETPTPHPPANSFHIWTHAFVGEGITMATLHQDALIFVFVLARHGTRWNQIKRRLFFSSFRPEMEGKGWGRDLAGLMWLHNINSLWNYTTIRAWGKGGGSSGPLFWGCQGLGRENRRGASPTFPLPFSKMSLRANGILPWALRPSSLFLSS